VSRRGWNGSSVVWQKTYMSYLRNRTWRPIGLWDVKVPTLSRVDNRLIDSGKFVSPTHQSHFTSQQLFFLCFWCHWEQKVEFPIRYAGNISLLGGSLSPRHGASSGCGWRGGLQLWRVTTNGLNKQRRTKIRGGPLLWRLLRAINNKLQVQGFRLTQHEFEYFWIFYWRWS
jgi:hypothetical protein